MPMNAAQLRWLRDHYLENDPKEAEYMTDEYAEELAYEDGERVVLWWRDREKYPREAAECLFASGDRSDYGRPLPNADALRGTPKPTQSAKAKMEGKWPAHIATDNPAPPEYELPIEPGPQFDLIAARTIQMHNTGGAVDLAAYSFITTAFRQDHDQREAARKATRETKQKQFGALSLVNELERDELEEWMTAMSKEQPEGYGSISYKDISTVRQTWEGPSTEWLNDAVINHFIDVVGRKMQDRGRKTWVISSSFAVHARKSDWRNLEGWARKVKFNSLTYKSFDSIILPWNTGSHWILLIVEPRDLRVQTWDSNRSGMRSSCEMEAARLLQAFLRHLIGGQWTIEPRRGPKQDDFNMCGAVVCLNAAVYGYHERDSTLRTITAKEAEDLRDWILLIVKDGGRTDGYFERLK